MPQTMQTLLARYVMEVQKIYDFNMDHEIDIKPISKSEEHFRKWVVKIERCA